MKLIIHGMKFERSLNRKSAKRKMISFGVVSIAGERRWRDSLRTIVEYGFFRDSAELTVN